MNNHDAAIISCTTLSPTINISDNLLKTTFDSIALRPDTFNKKTKDFLSNYFLINNGSLIFAYNPSYDGRFLCDVTPSR